jgi:hypothetical protein
MVRRLLLVAIALCFVGANRPDEPIVRAKFEKLAADPDTADISGYYTCKGQEAGGKPYAGIAVITRKNDVYLVQWVIGAGSTFTGIGIRQGNTLAASWTLPPDKNGVAIRGINMYKIEPGKLIGKWTTLPGPGVQQTETLTFLKSLEAEPAASD